jgi:hypothetical protein
MKLKLLKFEKLLTDEDILKEVLEKTRIEYRPFDPGQYLYNLLLQKREKIDIFSDEYLELTYTTLIAWNMNGRGAKLNDFELFKESIRKNKDKINSLKEYKIENLTESEKNIFFETVDDLFMDLDLIGKSWTGKKIKSKIVTFSKTLHFLLPNLFVPIDRRYTLDFFYNNKMVPTHEDIQKNDNKQLEVFKELYELFLKLAKTYDLSKYVDNKWNANIPKIIDNAVIGSSKMVNVD